MSEKKIGLNLEHAKGVLEELVKGLELLHRNVKDRHRVTVWMAQAFTVELTPYEQKQLENYLIELLETTLEP